jgi:hypothetical protein
MKIETIDVQGDIINRRLDEQIRIIERASVMLEELKVVPGEPLSMAKDDYKELSELLSQYEEFVEHFKETTEDLIKDVRDMIGGDECFEGERDEDEDIPEPEDEDEDNI